MDSAVRGAVTVGTPFGSDTVLGEGLFFVDDQASVAGQNKQVNVGEGTVVVRSSFGASEGGGGGGGGGGGTRPGTAQRRPSTSQQSMGGDATSELLESPESRRLPRRSFLSRRHASGS